MPYTKQTWDDDNPLYPVSDTRMAYLEDGIEFATTTAEAAYAPGAADVAVADGGTGASTMTAARNNLGLGTIAVLPAPAGAVVGTTEVQTLTNKTLTAPSINNATFGGTFSVADGSLAIADTSGLQAALDSKAPTVHVHATADVTSGTFPIARLPIGTTSTTVPLGNDARFSDTRTPTDNSVTAAKIQAGAVTLAKTDIQGTPDATTFVGHNGTTWVWEVPSGGAGAGANLDSVEAPTTITITSDTGSDAVIPAADGTNAGLVLPAEKTKLAGIATGATQNDTDANLRARSSHTGTQLASTVSDFAGAADLRVAAAVGVSVQGFDSDLTAWAGKTAPAGVVVGTTDTQTLTNKTLTAPSMTNITVTGTVVIPDASLTIARTSGLQAALDAKQASDTELTAIGGLTSAADRLPYFTGSGTASLAIFSSFGRSVVATVDAGGARIVLGAAAAVHVHAQSDVTGLPAALAALAPLASPTFTGLVTTPALKVTGGTLGVGKVLTSVGTDGVATWEDPTGGSGSTDLDTTLGASTVIITSSTGADATLIAADATNAGLMLPAEKTRVTGSSLTALGSVTPAADRLAYFTGANTAAVATFTAFSRSVVAAADATTARTTLGVLTDPVAGTAGMRTLGTSATSGAAGNDARLSDQRTPLDGSVTLAKTVISGTAGSTKVVGHNGTTWAWVTPAGGGGGGWNGGTP